MVEETGNKQISIMSYMFYIVLLCPIMFYKKNKAGLHYGYTRVWATLFCKGGLKAFLEEKPELLQFNCI